MCAYYNNYVLLGHHYAKGVLSLNFCVILVFSREKYYTCIAINWVAGSADLDCATLL